MSQEITLLPCPVPWCDGIGNAQQYEGISQKNHFYIKCSKCQARTPVRDTSEEAAELWNTRPQAEALGELETNLIEAAIEEYQAVLDWPNPADYDKSTARFEATRILIESRAADKEVLNEDKNTNTI